jgi:predicted aspartyl protease
MHQFILSRAALILLYTTLAVLTVACNGKQRVTARSGEQQSVPNNQNVASPVTTMAPLNATPQPQATLQPVKEISVSYFEQGLDKAVGALSISQSAKSTNDWNLVAIQLADAIALMRKVPVDNPDFATAQAKILDYQLNLKDAIQKAAPPVNLPRRQAQRERIAVAIPQVSVAPTVTSTITKPSITETPAAPAEQLQSPLPNPIPLPPPKQQEVLAPPTIKQQDEQQVYTVGIKRRIGGTPIIEVTFNGTQPFEMIVDTGASGTVITQNMANALGVVEVGKTKANTANSKGVEFPIGYVDSMEVAGAKVNHVAVAIASADLETGLLGHDFFGDYDITIKRDVVEFRPRSRSPIGQLPAKASQSNPIQETEFSAPNAPKELPSGTDP